MAAQNKLFQRLIRLGDTISEIDFTRVQFGIYACSPEDSSFTAIFTDMQFGECAWKAHDGLQADY